MSCDNICRYLVIELYLLLYRCLILLGDIHSWSFKVESLSKISSISEAIKTVSEDGLKLKFLNSEMKSDKYVVIEAIKSNSDSFYYACDLLKQDREFVKEVLKVNGRALYHVSSEFKSDEELVYIAATNFSLSAVDWASEEIQNSKSFILKLISEFPYSFYSIPEKFKHDREFILQAIQEHGEAIVYAPEELKADSKVMLQAISSYEDAFFLADSALKEDRQFLLNCLEVSSGVLINFIDSTFVGDTGFLMESVGKNPNVYCFLPDVYKLDYELALFLITSKKFTSDLISFLPAGVINEVSLLKQLLINFRYDEVFPFSSDKTRANSKIMIFAIIHSGHEALDFSSDSLRNDKEFMFEAVRINPLCLKYASDELKINRDLVELAIRIDGLAIQYSADIFRADKEMALKAVQSNENACHYISKRFSGDSDFLKLLGGSYQFIMAEEGCNPIGSCYLEILEEKKMLSFSKSSDFSFSKVPYYFRANKSFVMEAIKNSDDFYCISDELKNDPDVVSQMISCHPWSYSCGVMGKNAKKDMNVALKLSEHDAGYLVFIEKSLRSDLGVLMSFVHKSSGEVPVLSMLNEEDCKNQDLLYSILLEAPEGVLFLNDEIRDNVDFASRVCRDNPMLLKFFSKKVRDNKLTVLTAVCKNGNAVKYASNRLKNDKAVVMNAMLNSDDAYYFLNKNFNQDDDVLSAYKAHQQLKGLSREYHKKNGYTQL